MNNNLVAMWCCITCSTIWQADGNGTAAAIWLVMSAVYGVFSIVQAFKS